MRKFIRPDSFIPKDKLSIKKPAKIEPKQEENVDYSKSQYLKYVNLHNDIKRKFNDFF